RLMITALGKEYGQVFTKNELINFPDKELQTIDKLWVTHSKGMYGFSVQKEIYLGCGGIADGSYNEEVFENFGDAVAWREKSSWTFDIKWDGSGSRGHLPSKIVFIRGGAIETWVCWSCRYLFSHMAL
ncbi:MAG: GUN4 domain-containing protein, partial [Cyanobacteria bacterium J06636_28]